MKKIPALFVRDEFGIRNEPNPLAAWVFAGEGIATRKWDGAACRWADGKLWARYDAKRGKTPPPDFVPCQDPDPITGHYPGWIPATGPEHKWIREAAGLSAWQDGTYEACGPKINGNPERLSEHVLIRHGTIHLPDVPTDWEGLRAYFAQRDIEGVVWWRDPLDDNCDKVKITAAALGVDRPHLESLARAIASAAP